MADLLAFAETPGRAAAPIEPPAPRSGRDVLPGWVQAAWARVLGWGPVVSDPTTDRPTLHELRLETKRLRDLITIVAPLAGQDPAPLTRPLVRLQDRLGSMSDATVAATAARAFVRGAGDALTDSERAAIASFAAAQDLEAVVAIRRARTDWRLATSPAARRRVARLIGSL
jgi:CHAD domain-containing protein